MLGTRFSISNRFLALTGVLVCCVFAAPAAAESVTGATGPAAEAAQSAETQASVEQAATDAAAADAQARASALPTLSLSIGDVYRYRGRRYVLPRTRVEIEGKVNAELDGQSVKVIITKKGHTVATRTVELSQRGGVSSFSFHFRTGKKGKYIAKLELTADQEALIKAGDDESVSVVRTDVHRGSSGVAVRLFQSKLKSLKFVVPRNGHFDAATGRAFIAYRKSTGLKRIESAGYTVARKLAEGKGGFHLKHPGAGRHVEVDISKQLMAFADNGHVVRIYHVSTGAPATPTVRGTFHVYRKDPGTNAKGMVKSSYFVGGYAIHGYASVPPFNASHGCVRVPVPNAASIYAWVHMGTRVDTYL